MDEKPLDMEGMKKGSDYLNDDNLADCIDDTGNKERKIKKSKNQNLLIYIDTNAYKSKQQPSRQKPKCFWPIWTIASTCNCFCPTHHIFNTLLNATA